MPFPESPKEPTRGASHYVEIVIPASGIPSSSLAAAATVFGAGAVARRPIRVQFSSRTVVVA